MSGFPSGFPCADESDLCPDYEKLGPTRILPHLYVGCMQDALDVHTKQQHGITHVLNVTQSCPKPPDIEEDDFLRIPINDGYIDKLLPHIDSAVEFIERVKQQRGRVLVHCMAGISRSAAITIAYIMKTKMITCEQAYRMVKAQRSIVSPNFNFLGQLLEYEKALNVTTSPCSGAGVKRKRFELDLDIQSPFHGTSNVTNQPSPVHSKRLHVTKNNNSITSLSPASAMANLKFEHTLEKLNSLPPSTTDSTSNLTYLSTAPLNPPKRSHSWNSLAELTSKPDSPDSPTTVKHRKGLQAIRPRSLNLSLSNISVPTAVLQLNAQVERSLSHETRHVRSSSVIPNITEELEVSTSDSESSRNTSINSIKDAVNSRSGSTHALKSLSLPLQAQFNQSSASACARTTELGYEYLKSPAVSDLSASQPSLSTPSPSELVPDIKLFMHELASINWAPTSRFNITPARTAPSDLDKSGSNVTTQYIERRRRSRSLENLISPGYEDASVVCMKCGRTDKGNICHGFSGPPRDRVDRISRPNSLCGSSEMIQVS